MDVDSSKPAAAAPAKAASAATAMGKDDVALFSYVAHDSGLSRCGAVVSNFRNIGLSEWEEWGSNMTIVAGKP